MTTLHAIERHIRELNTSVANVLERQLEAIRRSFITCIRCRARSRLQAWTFIQGSYYVEPFGCTEGDYWLESKTEACHIVCPRCDHENYIFTHPQKDKLVALLAIRPHQTKSIFAAVKERRIR